MNVAILIYDNVEVLDFAGPFEVFTTAARVYARLHPETDPLFEVFTVGRRNASVAARGGLNLLPRCSLHQHPPLDILVVPGGIVTDELSHQDVVDWIRITSQTTQVTASVCTGAFLLAKGGLISGKTVATHWEDIETFERMFPDVRVDRSARWVDEGRIVTSAGIAAGIDMALHLVARFEGEELARLTARQMDYPLR